MTHASGDIQEKSCPAPDSASGISTEAVLKARIRRSLQRLDRPLVDAVSLEPEMYRDAAVFELERKDVFRRNWVSVCRLEDLSGVTNCKAVEIAGERLFVIRKRSGDVRALSRTCAHRWAELASPEGQVQRLVCPNHAWVYDLDGQLIGAPQMDAAEVRARFGCRLDSFACETWQGWVFVNLDGNARPLGEGLAAIDAQVAPWQLDRMRRILPPIIFEGPFNWKTICENLGEAYHVIGVHKTTVWPSLDYTKSEWTQDPDLYCRSEFPTQSPDGAGLLGGNPIPVPNGFCGTWAYNLFPCHLFGLTHDFCVWQRLEVYGPDRLRMEMHVLAPPETNVPGALLDELSSSIRAVEQEDQDAFARIARGTRSASARPAPFCKHEFGTWAFQRWWAAHIVQLTR